MGKYKKEEIKRWEKEPIKLTDDFYMMMDKITPRNDVVWALFELDTNEAMLNPLGIKEIDVSEQQFSFDVTYYDGKKNRLRIYYFLNEYFKGKLTEQEKTEFTMAYNRLMETYNGFENHKPSEKKHQLDDEYSKKYAYYDDIWKAPARLGKPIVIPEFKYNPKDVKQTFISLVTETYPHGHEEGVLEFLPKDLEKDKYGNYYKIIGNGNTIFTCHLDTASREKEKIIVCEYEKDGSNFLASDGNTILGADDKAGVTILLYMMAHNVPGVYWFFIGEERGGIGSGKVANDLNEYPFMTGKQKMISFDRRNYYSVITEQAGSTCCSDEFGLSLCEELNKSGMALKLDPTGVFTDSANFVDDIGECTNVSVGYFNEHTHSEIQNITYLELLAKSCVEADWNKLTIKRTNGFDDALSKKYGPLLSKLKKTYLYNDFKMKGYDGVVYIKLEIEDISVEHLQSDVLVLNSIFVKYDLDPDIRFSDNTILIEIK